MPEHTDTFSFERNYKDPPRISATSLGSSSSAARALAAGAKNIERVDKLVQAIGKSMGLHHDEVDATVALVDAWLEKNRAAE
ncbi:MAG: hypothetical protein ACPHW3_09070 [Candidatus Puniceispirillales bacterium]